MTATAVKDKPTKKVPAELPKLATTGQIEMRADLFVRTVAALDHIRGSDDSRPVLTALHLFVDGTGTSVTVYATDSYKMAKVTLPCEATPRLETMVRFDTAAVKRLGRAGNVIVRVGQVGDFALSSVGHWTGRGVHVANEDGALAFGSVVSYGDAGPLDFEKLISSANYATWGESAFAAWMLADLAKVVKAFTPQVRGFPEPHLRIHHLDELKAGTFTVTSGDIELLILAMPVRVSS